MMIYLFFQGFDGLHEKLLIHAERDKADALKDLLHKYDTDPAFREPHPQFDIKTRILSLLWHLSENPLGSNWTKDDLTKPSDNEEDEKGPDWRKILAEGEDEWQCGSEEELSEWSEVSEDVDSEGKSEREEEEKEAEATWLKPEVLFGPETAVEPEERIREADKWLRGQVQNQYWKELQVKLPLRKQVIFFVSGFFESRSGLHGSAYRPVFTKSLCSLAVSL